MDEEFAQGQPMVVSSEDPPKNGGRDQPEFDTQLAKRRGFWTRRLLLQYKGYLLLGQQAVLRPLAARLCRVLGVGRGRLIRGCRSSRLLIVLAPSS